MIEKPEPGIVVVDLTGEAHCFVRSRIKVVEQVYGLLPEDEENEEVHRWSFVVERTGRHISDRMIYDNEAEAIADRARVLKFVEEGVVDAQ